MGNTTTVTGTTLGYYIRDTAGDAFGTGVPTSTEVAQYISDSQDEVNEIAANCTQAMHDLCVRVLSIHKVKCRKQDELSQSADTSSEEQRSTYSWSTPPDYVLGPRLMKQLLNSEKKSKQRIKIGKLVTW